MGLQSGLTYKLNSTVKTGSAPGKSEYQAGGGSQFKIKGTRNVGGRTFYDIDQTAFGGGTGWVEASALEGAASANDPAPQQQSSQPQSSSMPSVSSMMPSRPAPLDINSIYNSAYNNPDIAAANERIKMNNEAIMERRRALADAEGTINDNPFYSEGTRVGRVAKLQDRAQADIGNFINEGQIASNDLSRFKADAETKVNLALKQYDINRQEYQDNLSQFNMLLSSGALAGASDQDIAQIAQSTGISPNMLQSIIDTQRKASEVKPQLETLDDGSNQYVVAIDKDGNVINRQVMGASKPKSTGTGTDAKKEAQFYGAIDDGVAQLQKGASWGSVWNKIHLMFPEIAPEALDTLLGTEWRTPGAYENYRTKTASKQYNQGTDEDSDLFNE